MGRLEWDGRPRARVERGAARVEAAAGQPVHTRGRKDRRKWCRGKPGVEHQATFGMRPGSWIVSHATRMRWTLECGFRYGWALDEEDRAGLLTVPPARLWPAWSCLEMEWCTKCGKILNEGYGNASRCPAWLAWLTLRDTLSERPEPTGRRST